MKRRMYMLPLISFINETNEINELLSLIGSSSMNINDDIYEKNYDKVEEITGEDKDSTWSQITYRSKDGFSTFTKKIYTTKDKKEENIEELKVKMKNYVDKQEYEKAAEVRDQIKELEKKYGLA